MAVAVLRPPVALALARNERQVPAPSPLWSYEPKMDFCPRFALFDGGAIRGVLVSRPGAWRGSSRKEWVASRGGLGGCFRCRCWRGRR